MSASHVFSLAVLFALSAAVMAQEAPALARAGAPMAAASMPQDCAKSMPRHDHGAERAMPTPPMACSGAVDKTAAKSNAKLGHDHTKFHKLM